MAMDRALDESPSPRAPDRSHGGPDARGPVRWDFSTNANAAGPCPLAVDALARADATRYADPDSHALRERLAAWHGVAPSRVLVAASASEFIQRVTAVGARIAPGAVAVPALAYGDYAAAASAWGRPTVVHGEPPVQAPCNAQDDRNATRSAPRCASLRWYCAPSSPEGRDVAAPALPGAVPTVLDAVYAPLRLAGPHRWSRAARDQVFELHSPNKALGLPGVRGAYVIAPLHADWPVDTWCAALQAAQPSWPLGAHAVALLNCWTEPGTQAWLRASRRRLRRWTEALRQGLDGLGLQPQPSVTPFLCARRPPAADTVYLRSRGVAVRDTTSFGLPGHMRVSAQPPAARAALLEALFSALARHPGHPGALT